MANRIIGREKELQILDSIVQSENAEFLAVYGRRRAGKISLIYEHLKDKIVFSFSGAFEQPAKIQIYNFFQKYLRLSRSKKTTPPKNWSMAFSYLTDYLYKFATKINQKSVVFIDEMPWLDTPRSGFVSALEYFWNQHGSKMNHLLLIACGSAAS